MTFFVQSEFCIRRTTKNCFSQTTIVKLFSNQSELDILPTGLRNGTDLAPAFLVSDLDLVLEMSDDLVASGTHPDEPPAVRCRDPLRRRDLHVYLMHRTVKNV